MKLIGIRTDINLLETTFIGRGSHIFDLIQMLFKMGGFAVLLQFHVVFPSLGDKEFGAIGEGLVHAVVDTSRF